MNVGTRRFGAALLYIVLAAGPGLARHEIGACGTDAQSSDERLFLHRQSVRARAGLPRPRAAGLPANRDLGDVALIEDSDGVVARQNQFNLDGKTLQFFPAGGDTSRYRYAVADQGYDAAAASSGAPLAALDDDDARLIDLPFAFPFYGTNYRQVYVNSDGNLTFTMSDTAVTERSLGRMAAGPPRISPLFDDLDPSRTAGGVRVLSDGARVVVSWVAVPEWQSAGIGPRQTFQARLYPDGRIEFAYSGINATSAVTGISPGGLRGGSVLVDFRSDPSGEYAGTVAERFGNTLTVDIVTAAQKFYESHEDSYDYLVIFNNMDIPPLPGAVAYESTVRNAGTGFGAEIRDDGRQYGSESRLLAVLNMGHLSQYPADPNALVPARAVAGDTPLTTLGHEAGHLFLARASVLDPENPAARPMLGYQNAHWSFLFNSEASLLEGERIIDRGANVSPRFITAETVQGYAPLDQYLMGFRAAQDVPDTFLVTGAPAFLQTQHPIQGYPIEGSRRDVTVGEIVQVMGRRTPDHTVAQRRFRFAFVLVVAAGTEPSAADLAKIEAYRRQFEGFFSRAANGNAEAETSLRKSLKLSLFPAAGIVAGAAGTAAVGVQRTVEAPLTVQLRAVNGNVAVPSTVTIPAGASSAAFEVAGTRAGVEEITATPADPGYESAVARVQVADAAVLRLAVVSGDRQIVQDSGPLPEPVVVRLTDENGLEYPGARIAAAASTGGSVIPEVAAIGADGTTAFKWSPGAAEANQLRLTVEAMPQVGLTIEAGASVPVTAAVVSAASFESGVAAGAIHSIFGANLAGGQQAEASGTWPPVLAGVRVLLNGAALPLLFVSDMQINFYVPAETPLGPALLTVVTPGGAEARAEITVSAVQPGVFAGGVVHAGTGVSAAISPVQAGEYLEIYCTGLGPTRLVDGLQRTVSTPVVFFGATPVQPSYSGLAPGYSGLYQVNVQVPAGLAPGTARLVLSINQAHSNGVEIGVQ